MCRVRVGVRVGLQGVCVLYRDFNIHVRLTLDVGDYGASGRRFYGAIVLEQLVLQLLELSKAPEVGPFTGLEGVSGGLLSLLSGYLSLDLA